MSIDNLIEDFYKNYNIYKVRKMTKIEKYEESEILDKIEDKCIMKYLSREIENKQTDYKNYLLNKILLA